MSHLKNRNSQLLADDLQHRRTRFEGRPEVVNLLTTELCNLQCKMCSRSLRPGTRWLDRDSIRAICDELFPTARKAIVAGFQGEPLLMDFDLVLDAALEHDVKIDLTTNGTRLTPSLYRAAKGALNILNVSVDSHIPEVYADIRSGGKFGVVDDNLSGIREERRRETDRVAMTLSAVVMRSNVAHLAGFVAYAASVGADAVALQPLRQFDVLLPEEDIFQNDPTVHNRDRAGGRPDPLRECGHVREYLEELFAPVRRAARDNGINVYFGDFALPSETVKPIQLQVELLDDSSELCASILRHFTVVVTGDVYPCCHPTDVKLGNVHRARPLEIWNGKRAQRVRQTHFERRGMLFCKGCVQAPYIDSSGHQRMLDAFKRTRLMYQHVRGKVLDWLRREQRNATCCGK